MKRKNILLLLLLLSLLLLAGWGKKQVELLNDEKLIDLDAAIQICLQGSDSATAPENPEVTAAAKVSATPKPTRMPILPSVTPSPTIAPSVIPQPTTRPTPSLTPAPRTVVISVRGREITYDSVVLGEVDQVKVHIGQDHAGHISFRLVDNFAEAHVYRQLMAILEEMKTKIGIRYSRD